MHQAFRTCLSNRHQAFRTFFIFPSNASKISTQPSTERQLRELPPCIVQVEFSERNISLMRKSWHSALSDKDVTKSSFLSQNLQLPTVVAFKSPVLLVTWSHLILFGILLSNKVKCPKTTMQLTFCFYFSIQSSFSVSLWADQYKKNLPAVE